MNTKSDAVKVVLCHHHDDGHELHHDDGHGLHQGDGQDSPPTSNLGHSVTEVSPIPTCGPGARQKVGALQGRLF